MDQSVLLLKIFPWKTRRIVLCCILCIILCLAILYCVFSHHPHNSEDALSELRSHNISTIILKPLSGTLLGQHFFITDPDEIASLMDPLISEETQFTKVKPTRNSPCIVISCFDSDHYYCGEYSLFAADPYLLMVNEKTCYKSSREIPSEDFYNYIRDHR